MRILATLPAGYNGRPSNHLASVQNGLLSNRVTKTSSSLVCRNRPWQLASFVTLPLAICVSNKLSKSISGLLSNQSGLGLGLALCCMCETDRPQTGKKGKLIICTMMFVVKDFPAG